MESRKKRVVVLTGAGMSVESGLKTFRGSDGMWADYRIEEVCTAEAIERNPELVFEFYNARRREYMSVKPNEGHTGLKELEKKYDVKIITQNVDDLHEKAGSTSVLHLHGELNKARGMFHPDRIYDIKGTELNYGDKAPDGELLRPHIVFFGEAVPNIEPAVEIVQTAEILVIIGTSLVVYPAAGLIQYAPTGIPIYVIDPNIPQGSIGYHIIPIEKGASEGVKELLKALM